MPTISVPNTLRNHKLAAVVAEIVASVEQNEVVEIYNENDFTTPVVDAVERAKKELARKGVRVFQTNKLDHREVFNKVSEQRPLDKPKVHHYKVKLSVRLSTSPIEPLAGEATQTNS